MIKNASSLSRRSMSSNCARCSCINATSSLAKHTIRLHMGIVQCARCDNMGIDKIGRIRNLASYWTCDENRRMKQRYSSVRIKSKLKRFMSTMSLSKSVCTRIGISTTTRSSDARHVGHSSTGKRRLHAMQIAWPHRP